MRCVSVCRLGSSQLPPFSIMTESISAACVEGQKVHLQTRDWSTPSDSDHMLTHILQVNEKSFNLKEGI